MHRVSLTILFAFSFSMFLYSQQFDKQILEEFSKWKTKASSSNGIVETNLESILSPSSIENSKNYPMFSLELFEYTVQQESKTYLCDLDSDSVNEVCTLILEGSGRYPYFYILRRNSQSGKYMVLSVLEKYLTPIKVLDSVYLIESLRDWNSGRLNNYVIYKVESDFTISSKFKIQVNYNYNFPAEILPYINTFTVNSIGNQEYDKLGIKINLDNKFTLDIGNFSVKGKINYTSVGYYPTTVDISIFKNGTVQKIYEGIWGFNIVNFERNTYLSILEMDERNRIASNENFRLSIFRLSDWKKEFSSYIVADEIFTINEQ